MAAEPSCQQPLERVTPCILAAVLKFQGRSVCNVRANPVIIHLHEDEARQTCRVVSAAGLPDVAVGLEYALSNDRRR